MSVLRVGLTGGIASGKSTVGKIMAEAGCVVTDADRIVAELYEPGEKGTAAVVELFGDEVLDARGAVDREAVAQVVFGDPEARKRLEQAIHPLVGERYRQILEESEGVVVFEATLLAETGGHANYEAVVTVEADDALRLERAVERGLERDAAEARMAAQATSAQRRAVADYVIENEGTLDDLRRATLDVVAALRKRLEPAD